MNLTFIIKTPVEDLIIQALRLLSESLIHDIDSEPSQKIKESCAGFLARVWGNMQPLYRNALILIILYLKIGALLRYKKRFTKLSTIEMSEIVKKWRNSRLAYKRDFIRLIFNLTLIAYYDNEEVTDGLGIDRNSYLKALSFYR